MTEDLENKETPVEEPKESHTVSLNFKTNHIFVVLVSILLLFSVVQAFQINSLQDDIESGDGITGSAVKSTVQRSAPAPRSAPAMVGGC